MKKSDGMLVSREYLERLDAAVFGTKAERTRVRRLSSESFYKVREVSVTGTWTQEGTSYWWRTSGRLRNQKRTSEGAAIELFMASRNEPELLAGSVYAVWRGRWEIISSNELARNVAAGNDGITITDDGTTQTISNAGVLALKIRGSVNEEKGTVYFNANQFQWIPSSLDIGGKKEIALRTKRVVNVPTDVEVTTGTITYVSRIFKNQQNVWEAEYATAEVVTAVAVTKTDIIVLG